MQLINVRGTTSSGKTTCLREIIKASKTNKIFKLTSNVQAHLLDNCCTIGVYKPGSKFGGVDAIATMDYVEAAIFEAFKYSPVVVFEGLLVSHSFQRWFDFSEKVKFFQKENSCIPRGMVWAFIVPPYRVNANRMCKRNGIQKINEKGDAFVLNFIQRVKSINRLRKKVKEAKGQKYVDLGWTAPSMNLHVLIAAMNDGFVLKGGSVPLGIDSFL